MAIKRFIGRDIVYNAYSDECSYNNYDISCLEKRIFFLDKDGKKKSSKNYLRAKIHGHGLEEKNVQHNSEWLFEHVKDDNGVTVSEGDIILFKLANESDCLYVAELGLIYKNGLIMAYQYSKDGKERKGKAIGIDNIVGKAVYKIR